MPRKGKQKSRRLWLHIHVKAPGVSRNKVLRTLIESIDNETYEHPKKWKVKISWKNSLFGKMKTGDFTEEMLESSDSSRGWDIAVRDYLERRIRK